MYMYACCRCGSRVVRKGLWCYGISVLLSFGGRIRVPVANEQWVSASYLSIEVSDVRFLSLLSLSLSPLTV